MGVVYYKEVEWRGKKTSIHSTALLHALRCGRQGPTNRNIACPNPARDEVFRRHNYWLHAPVCT